MVRLARVMFVPSKRGSGWESCERWRDGEAARGLDEKGSAEQRWEIWQTAGAIIRDHPVMGVGWGAYGEANAVYAEWRGPGTLNPGKRDTHSSYLNLLAETGWPGFFLFLGMIASVLLPTDAVRRRIRHTMPARSSAIRMLELGLLGFLLAGVFASYNKLSFLYLQLAVAWAMAEVLRREAAQHVRTRRG